MAVFQALPYADTGEVDLGTSFREVLERLHDVHDHEVQMLRRELEKLRMERPPLMQGMRSTASTASPASDAMPTMPLVQAKLRPGTSMFAPKIRPTAVAAPPRFESLRNEARPQSVLMTRRLSGKSSHSVVSPDIGEDSFLTSTLSFHAGQSMLIGRWKAPRMSEDRVAAARRQSISGAINTLERRKTARKLAEDFAMAKGWVATDFRQKKQRLVSRLLDHYAFDIVCSVAIILNALLLGASADYAMRHLPDDPDAPPIAIELCNYLFTAWFLVELVIRILGDGPLQFFCERDVPWNIFDLIVVSLDVISMMLGWFQASSSGINGLTSVRMLRVLRVARALRIVKMMRFFKELRMMVQSIIQSFISLFWSIVLLILLIFVFSILLMQGVTYHLYIQANSRSATEDELEYWFGNIVETSYLLFLCISNGIDWGEICDLLLTAHWGLGLMLCFYIFFTVFAMMNIITGLFVDTALASSQKDTEEIIQDQMETEESTLRKLKQIFDRADTSDSGFITKEEFEAQLEDSTVRRTLRALELELNEARGIFAMLDMDGSGSLSIEEFVFGLMRMKGGARTIDLATLQYENMRMMDTWARFFNFVEVEFMRLEAALGADGAM